MNEVKFEEEEEKVEVITDNETHEAVFD